MKHVSYLLFVCFLFTFVGCANIVVVGEERLKCIDETNNWQAKKLKQYVENDTTISNILKKSRYERIDENTKNIKSIIKDIEEVKTKKDTK